MSPTVVSLDFETALLDGSPSVEYYRGDFRAISCAISWINSHGQLANTYLVGEEEILRDLEELMEHSNPIVVHNLQFEYGVVTYRFPTISLNWHADTMRLAQVGDNGGKDYDEDALFEDEEAPVKTYKGLSLQACISRWLDGAYHNHKEPYYQYIRDQGVKKGQEGKNLDKLPPEMLKEYNVADSDNTLRLYNTLTTHFKDQGYNWTLDHYLYMEAAKRIAEAKGRGILVDRERLSQNVRTLTYQLGQISYEFLVKFEPQIAIIEQENLQAVVLGRKTEKGQASAWLRCIEEGLHLFNLTSVKQKARLFVDLLGVKPQFFTEKGGPAFGKAYLSQYGEGGTMLLKRGTLLIALKQMENLLELSAYDGRYHVDLRAAGTKTGRMAGGRLD